VFNITQNSTSFLRPRTGSLLTAASGFPYYTRGKMKIKKKKKTKQKHI